MIRFIVLICCISSFRLADGLSVGEVTRARVEGLAKSRSQQWFEQCVESVEKSDSAIINSWRATGLSVLEAVGAPNGRAETWRYSHDLNSIWQSTPSSDLVEDAILPKDLPENAAVVVDGVVLQSPGSISEDIFFGSALNAPDWALEMVGSDLGLIPEVEFEKLRPNDALGSSPWAALNAACLRDAIILAVKSGVKSETTVHMVHIHAKDCAVFPRFAVALAPQSNIILHQTFYGKEENVISQNMNDGINGVCNSRTTIKVPFEATLSHVYSVLPGNVYRHHHESSYVQVEGTYHGTILATSRARLNADIELARPLASARMDGLCLSDAEPIELYSSIRHEVPDATSAQDIRLVAAGNAHLIFKGRIAVPVLAQRTDAQQLCRSALLADTANALVMPCLDIIADDVKCTHGATVADLDDDALFFLLARGIDRSLAKALLVKGFCNDLLTSLVPLPPKLTSLLDECITSIVDDSTEQSKVSSS